MNESKVERKKEVTHEIKDLLISNYHNYEMCCFKRKMSAPKRLIDSKAFCFCIVSFVLEILSS